jgi:hypothetical protein
MTENVVFQELSKSLSDNERNDLLRKIRRSINFTEDSHEAVYRKDLDKSERDSLIKRDLTRLSILARFMLWIRSRLNGKGIEENFIATKMKQLKREINRKMPGVTGFETRDITPVLAHAVLKILVQITPLRPVYRKLWTDQSVFEATFQTILEKRIEEPKHTLVELISEEELVDVYAQVAGTKERLKSAILDRIQEYIEAIPSGTFDKIELGVLPIYHLKELVLFPYASFFNLFGYNPISEGLAEKPPFKNASAMLTLEFLEKLYYAVYTAAKIDEPVKVDDHLLQFIALSTFEDDGLEAVEVEKRKEMILENIRSIVRLANQFSSSAPLVELIRYFTHDPYHRLIFYMPRLYLRDFYQSILKMTFLTELDDAFPRIRKKYVEREINTLFKDHRLEGFRNYREYASIDYAKMGLPFFVHTQSLNILYNYIKWYYRSYVIDIVQILERGLLSQNRLTRDRLLQYAAAIEDTQDKIEAFDESLSTESEDGKLFQRLRFTLASEPSHQRMYRTMVLQKDREVNSILERGQESISSLAGLFGEILESTGSTMRTQLSNHYIIMGKPALLSNLLADRRENMQKLLDILNQVLKIEKG